MRFHLARMLVVIFVVVGLTACEQKNDCCEIIDSSIRVLYTNGAGEDLINSDADFDESNIRVYYKNGEEFDYVFDRNLDAPNMHKVDDETGRQILKVFLSNIYEDKRSTTLIELNPNVVDTIVGEFIIESGRETVQKVWVNGVEMEDLFFEIVK